MSNKDNLVGTSIQVNKKPNIFQQTIILINSIKKHIKSFEYDIFLFTTKNYDLFTKYIFEDVFNCFIIKENPDINDKKCNFMCKSKCFTKELNNYSHRIILDTDMYFIKEPKINFDYDILVTYMPDWTTLNKEASFLYEKHKKYFDNCDIESKKLLLKQYELKKDYIKINPPLFNGGLIIINNKISNKFGVKWLEYYIEGFKKSKNPGMYLQNRIGIIINGITKNWSSTPIGMNYYGEWRNILDTKLYKNDISLIHYLGQTTPSTYEKYGLYDKEYEYIFIKNKIKNIKEDFLFFIENKYKKIFNIDNIFENKTYLFIFHFEKLIELKYEKEEEKENKFYFINFKKHNVSNNPKHYELIDKLKINKNFYFIELDFDELILFIKKNIEKKYILIFSFFGWNGVKSNMNYWNEMNEILLFIKKLKIFKLKFVFFTGDIFNGLYLEKQCNFKYLDILYKNDNIHILNECLDDEDYIDNHIINNKYMYKINLKRKNMFYYSTRYVYKGCNVKFNSNPIIKIALSGQVNIFYEERLKFNNIMEKYKNIYKKLKVINGECENLLGNNFNIRLNKYICNFYSGVTCAPKSFFVTKLIEICSCGSLLLTDKSCEKILNKIGFFNDKNCIIIDINKENEVINKSKWILDKKNRKYIDNLRLNGYKHCISYFSLINNYNKFMSILKKINII